jgi:hypothetical protein
MEKITMISVLLAFFTSGFAQTTTQVTAFTQGPEQGAISYPKTVGYFSFILPLVTINQNATINDFSNMNNGFSIGFPTGINVLYTEKFGFSYEITPTIETGGGSSKISKILFDPGPMIRFKHGFTFIPRLAFQTDGRYGITPVFNQIVKSTAKINYFVALSLPMRVGNSEFPNIGIGFQAGVIFK